MATEANNSDLSLTRQALAASSSALPRNREMGIVHCCSFDSIPSDLGNWFVQQAMQAQRGVAATRVRGRAGKTRGRSERRHQFQFTLCDGRSRPNTT